MATAQVATPQVSPAPAMEAIFGFAATQILTATVEFELFAHIYRGQQSVEALRPGAQLLIAEMVPDEARRDATFPLLFAVNMRVNTEEGDTFTFSEYRRWLGEAGFRDVRTLEAPAPSPLTVAKKA